MLNAKIQDANIIKFGTLLLNSIVLGTQLLWAGVEAVRESSDKKLIYYCCTLLLLSGVLAPIFLGKFIVKIPPTVSIAWAGVGALILQEIFYEVCIQSCRRNGDFKA